ncbi:MAG: hypothetical protein JWN48_421 [Myxococcaceae bacterium]|nr:hypothetical protein [Myxococcaceae bacterium]
MRMHTRRWLSILALWLLAAGARAQVTAADKATAEALFDRGLSLLKEGKLEEACARLEQSNAVEHGIGTMLYLADCYERSGRTASAWALFREASSEARAAGQTERATAGRQRAERLEPVLARLAIEVPDASRTDGLTVTRNGAPVPEGVWGLPLPVDPGEQRIEAQAPGYLSQAFIVTVAKGPGSSKVTLPALKPAPANVASNTSMQTAPMQAQPAQGTTGHGALASAQERGFGKQKLIGIVVGSAGVALLAVGVGFGVRANHKNGDAKDLGAVGAHCNATRIEDAKQCVALTNSALTASRVADVGFIAGGAMIAGGLLTYFLTPRGERAPQVAFSAGSHGGALQVGGAF